MGSRAGNHLLLDEASGADFDFPADAERVDALVAGDGLRPRPHGLMVIAERSFAAQQYRPAGGEPHEIELAVSIQIDNAPQLGIDGPRVRLQSAAGASQPHTGSAGCGRQQIQRAVVVDIRDEEPRRRWRGRRRHGRPPPEDVLAPAVAAHRPSREIPRTFEGHDVEDAISVDIAESQREDRARKRGGRGTRRIHRLELPALNVQGNLERSLAVEEHRIGIAVIVDVTPREGAYVSDTGKRFDASPRAVAVVSKDDR